MRESQEARLESCPETRLESLKTVSAELTQLEGAVDGYHMRLQNAVEKRAWAERQISRLAAIASGPSDMEAIGARRGSMGRRSSMKTGGLP